MGVAEAGATGQLEGRDLTYAGGHMVLGWVGGFVPGWSTVMSYSNAKKQC